MIEVSEVRSASETLARAFEEYKSVNDRRLEEIERRGSADVLLSEKLSRMDNSINNMQDDITNVKAAMRRPGKALLGEMRGEGNSAYKQAFLNYIAKGNEVDLSSLQTKALEVINNGEGGFMVPPEMSDRIVTRQFDTTPMRQLATVMTISSDAVEMLRDTNEPSASWISELGVPSDTNDGGIGRIRIPVHELYAQPKATQKLLDDAVLNVEEWLINKVAAKFSRAENNAFVVGDGIGMPRGFTSYTAQAVSDSTRSWGVLQYVPTGVNGAFATSSPADVLFDLVYQLRVGYHPKASFIMPRAVSDMIRKFKENTTQAYIWQPGLQQGQPSTLLGFPVYLGEDMPPVATGSYSLAFGNFEEGYTIVDRTGMQILRDPYTGAPFIKFRCTKRTGGDVVNFEAIKLLKFSAS
ncbi:MAG: phage major capsid protein [Alphaproteobacteria bacterium]|nr:phage major capsid protein [Alphaproteobacteria bacterium]MBV8548707.1 phage major capsid protein [Alphaproteobacteria bacterium]